MLLRRFLNFWHGFRILTRSLGLNPRSFWRLFNLDRIIYYRTRSMNKILAYSKLPDGCVAIHFWDSLPTLDLIYFVGIYDSFRKIDEKDTVIDCGAHAGIFTLKAAMRARHGLVLAIEPDPHNYEILKANVKNNGLTNVITIRNALMDKSGTARLYLHPFLSEGSSLNRSITKDTESYAKYVMVQSTTLDDLAAACKIDNADLIKMAVNAAELEVIKGGEKLLSKSKHLAIEYDRKLSRTVELTRLLVSLGFKRISLQDPIATHMGFLFFERESALRKSN